jgi:hypothetical protein
MSVSLAALKNIKLKKIMLMPALVAGFMMAVATLPVTNTFAATSGSYGDTGYHPPKCYDRCCKKQCHPEPKPCCKRDCYPHGHDYDHDGLLSIRLGIGLHL